ncbi:MAG: ATP-binding protein [Cyanothece sp. SIO2G6]|nr:ATP-binding protein [Cyanothece sp. SIO2G6]
MQIIKIVNFKSLKDVEFKVNDLFLLLGEQASGKSTVSKLVYFFKSIKQDFIDYVYDNLDNKISEESIFVRRFWPRITTKFYNFFGSTKHLPNFEIVYTYNHDYTFTLTLKDNKRLKPNFSPPLYQALFYGQIHDLIKDVQKNLRQGDAFERRAFRSAINNLETFVERLLGDSRTPVFIPAGRNITVNYSAQFQLDFYGKLVSNLGILSRNKKRNADVEEASEASFAEERQSIDMYLMMEFLKHTTTMQDRFKSMSFDDFLQNKQEIYQLDRPEGLRAISERIDLILKGKYHQDQYGEKIYLDDNTYVHLNNASSGQQEAIRILAKLLLLV